MCGLSDMWIRRVMTLGFALTISNLRKTLVDNNKGNLLTGRVLCTRRNTCLFFKVFILGLHILFLSFQGLFFIPVTVAGKAYPSLYLFEARGEAQILTMTTILLAFFHQLSGHELCQVR